MGLIIFDRKAKVNYFHIKSAVRSARAIRTAQRPFRGNRALRRFPLLTQLLLLINGRSLSEKR